MPAGRRIFLMVDAQCYSTSNSYEKEKAIFQVFFFFFYFKFFSSSSLVELAQQFTEKLSNYDWLR